MHERFRADLFALALIAIIGAGDAAGWYRILQPILLHPPTPRIAFLDVGQGDAELLTLPGNVTVLTDAGPSGGALLSALDAAFMQGPGRASIDLAVISHPEADHFGGFAQLLDHYRVGAFLYNGRDASDASPSWNALLAMIRKKDIPLITVRRGDRIVYGLYAIDILSPDDAFARSGALNETGIVERIETPSWTALLAADIDGDVERALIGTYGLKGLSADILKVAHHGSATASGDRFLRTVAPRVAVIEVAQANPYHLPSSETLGRIVTSTRAKIFRTDEDGSVTVWYSHGALDVHEGR